MFLDLVLELEKCFTKEEIALITKAYQYASIKHEGVKRDSGEDYITHPLNVAWILFKEMHLRDVNSICAAFLHDVLEDTDTTKEEILEEFNLDIANLVDGVTKIKNINFTNKTEKERANTCILLKAAILDYRVILIKLADRLHNMRTIKFKKNREKAKAKCLETLYLFVPIADRIGAYKVKSELEDLAFKELYPRKFKVLEASLLSYIDRHKLELDEIENNIGSILNKENINNRVVRDYKSLYELYEGYKKNQKMANIHDLIIYRTSVASLSDCYLALMHLHQKYNAVNAGYFRDFISNPRPNGYKAIHTTVHGFSEHCVQMRIATFKMALQNRYGFAVLQEIFPDKSIKEIQDYLAKRDSFIASIKEIEELYKIEDGSFYEQVCREVLSKQVKVYSRGKVLYKMPIGSTVLDFAFRLSVDLGNKADRALVNGKEVGINYILKEGDTVDIIISENKLRQEREALDFVVTTLAKKEIEEGLRGIGLVRKLN